VTGWLGVAASARPRSDSVSMHAWVQSVARAGSGRDLRAGDTGENLSIRQW
jgi:hypothetical protein